MTTRHDEVRTVRIESRLEIRSSATRLFRALTAETLAWFPHTYGEERTVAIVVEPHVGGRHFEDWGKGAGYLYGHVTLFDPPRRFSTRGRLMGGVLIDSDYVLVEGTETTDLTVTKVAVGPMSDEEAESIRTYGDLTPFADALRAHVES